MFYVYPRFVYKTRSFLWFYSFLNLFFRKRQFKRDLKLFREVIVFYAKGGAKNVEKVEYKSLRKIVEKDLDGPYKATSPEMVELRRGR